MSSISIGLNDAQIAGLYSIKISDSTLTNFVRNGYYYLTGPRSLFVSTTSSEKQINDEFYLSYQLVDYNANQYGYLSYRNGQFYNTFGSFTATFTFYYFE